MNRRDRLRHWWAWYKLRTRNRWERLTHLDRMVTQ